MQWDALCEGNKHVLRGTTAFRAYRRTGHGDRRWKINCYFPRRSSPWSHMPRPPKFNVAAASRSQVVRGTTAPKARRSTGHRDCRWNINCYKQGRRRWAVQPPSWRANYGQTIDRFLCAKRNMLRTTKSAHEPPRPSSMLVWLMHIMKFV